ncbi:MAG: hypothetical protein ACOYY3_09425 [Chloroflexota bacterium]
MGNYTGDSLQNPFYREGHEEREESLEGSRRIRGKNPEDSLRDFKISSRASRLRGEINLFAVASQEDKEKSPATTAPGTLDGGEEDQFS